MLGYLQGKPGQQEDLPWLQAAESRTTARNSQTHSVGPAEDQELCQGKAGGTHVEAGLESLFRAATACTITQLTRPQAARTELRPNEKLQVTGVRQESAVRLLTSGCYTLTTLARGEDILNSSVALAVAAPKGRAQVCGSGSTASSIHAQQHPSPAPQAVPRTRFQIHCPLSYVHKTS